MRLQFTCKIIDVASAVDTSQANVQVEVEVQILVLQVLVSTQPIHLKL